MSTAAAAGGRFSIGGDLVINRMGFGAMRITGPGVWGDPADPAECMAVLRQAIDLGIDFIDTADSYGPFVSEDLIAKALHPYPSGLVIATKGGLTRSGPGRWEAVGRPEYLRQCVEMSLRRLKLEQIELYQFHRPDPNVPFEESLGALSELQSQGKIRHLGVSNVTPDQLALARRVIDVATVQNRYNLTDHSSEPVLKACEQAGIGFICWAPVAAGELARPGGPLDHLAERHGVTISQLSLAWLLRRSAATLLIPGTSKRPHLEENVRAAEIKLPDEEWAEVEKAI